MGWFSDFFSDPIGTVVKTVTEKPLETVALATAASFTGGAALAGEVGAGAIATDVSGYEALIGAAAAPGATAASVAAELSWGNAVALGASPFAATSLEAATYEAAIQAAAAPGATSASVAQELKWATSPANFSLSQIAGGTMDVVRSAGNVYGLSKLAGAAPRAASLGSGVSVVPNYYPASQAGYAAPGIANENTPRAATTVTPVDRAAVVATQKGPGTDWTKIVLISGAVVGVALIWGKK